MQKKPTFHCAFFNLHVLIALLFCAAVACSILNVPLLGFVQRDIETDFGPEQTDSGNMAIPTLK